MEKYNYLKQNGFTLIEMVVTISIFTVLIFGVSAILNNIFSNSKHQLLSMSNIDQARLALSTFTNEIRNATTGSDGSYPLNQAGDSQIIFFSNFKTGPNGYPSVVERIRYYVSGDTLYKGVVLPAGSPSTYNLSFESISSVVSGISTLSAPAFYYYDGNYDGSTSSLSQPVNINQVRFVKINLMVLNQITPADTSAFPITAGAAIRAIKDNLGN
jgi:prepilin-type N-terminal cleavage/methylation domain-containing protein